MQLCGQKVLLTTHTFIYSVDEENRDIGCLGYNVLGWGEMAQSGKCLPGDLGDLSSISQNIQARHGWRVSIISEVLFGRNRPISEAPCPARLGDCS